MSDKVLIFDTTLRDGEQAPGCSMTLAEKLEMARRLERLHVDVLEAGFAAASEGDFASVQAIAGQCKDVIVACLARCTRADIDTAYQAVKRAAAPRLHVFLATSPIHLKYKLRMTEKEVLERIRDCVTYARSLAPDVEFSCEDASRTPYDFLAQAVQTAVDCGAATVNLPDTVGYCTPAEMCRMYEEIKARVHGLEKVVLSAHNHDDLGLAVANSLASVGAGVRQIECTVNGIGERAGNAALEEIVLGLKTRADFYGCHTDVVTSEIYRTSKLLYNIIGQQIPPNKAIVGSNAFAHEAGIHQHGVLAEKSTYEIMSPAEIGVPENTMVLGKHSGKHAFAEHLESLGYHLTPEQITKCFTEFKKLADIKKYVSRRDIEAIVDAKKINPAAYGYCLQSFEVFASSGNTNTATIFLTLDDQVKAARGKGSGPADAAFHAINNIAGYDFALSSYSLNAVTEGQDAQAEAVVKVSLGERSTTGRGLSLDILEATILAYLNGVNKLLREEI